MIVDKKRFKDLKKESGGILKLGCSTVAQILDAPDLKKIDTCNTEIYPNGLYLSFIWSYKLYFPMTDFKKVTYDDNIIKIHLISDEMIRIKIDKEKDLIKFDTVLRRYLGFSVENLNIDKLNKSKIEIIREKNKNEKEERKVEMERLRKAGRTVPPSKQVSHKTNYDSNEARCPKCGSTSITANKKGFSLAKGALGVATVGAYGVLAAGHGKNKVLVTCLKCGHQWKPGK
ncbi:MAG: hypothetical protein RSA29_04440 [Clostridium sp.]|uniref:hypothetical protein n=1 Tax=Clostridium sp. TaxID=1506 RepID=UPI0032178C89